MHDGAGQLRLGRDRGRAQIAQRHAQPLIGAAQRHLRAVQVDRAVPAGLAQQRDHPLALAERVGADDVRALREQRHAVQQLLDLVRGGRVAEHRQGEGRLGDEHVARDRHERRAGRIRRALVVAGDHGAAAPPLHRDLRAAEHVARRLQPHADLADGDRLAVGMRLLRVATRSAPMRTRMIASVSGLASTAPWPGRAWSAWAWVMTARSTGRTGSMIEAAGLAVQAVGQDFQPGVGMRHPARCKRPAQTAKLHHPVSQACFPPGRQRLITVACLEHYQNSLPTGSPPAAGPRARTSSPCWRAADAGETPC